MVLLINSMCYDTVVQFRNGFLSRCSCKSLSAGKVLFWCQIEVFPTIGNYSVKIETKGWFVVGLQKLAEMH